MKKPWVLNYPLSRQQRLWSDWADAQANLSLRWAHTHFVGFVMSQLISMVLFQVSNFYSPSDSLVLNALRSFNISYVLKYFIDAFSLVVLCGGRNQGSLIKPGTIPRPQGWQVRVVHLCFPALMKYCNDPKFTDRRVSANSVDPDQTAPRGGIWSGSTPKGAIWSGSTLFLQEQSDQGLHRP